MGQTLTLAALGSRTKRQLPSSALSRYLLSCDGRHDKQPSHWLQPRAGQPGHKGSAGISEVCAPSQRGARAGSSIPPLPHSAGSKQAGVGPADGAAATRVGAGGTAHQLLTTGSCSSTRDPLLQAPLALLPMADPNIHAQPCSCSPLARNCPAG